MHGQRPVLGSDVTSFVGRRRETTEVKRLLANARLVTLTGVGGVGKTRLSIHVARDVARAYADGAWLVELAQVTEPALVPQVIAEALGIRDMSTRSTADVLESYLADKRLLLVLDNCEHLLESCGTLACRLLRACAGVTVLATSREALGVLGEHSWPVPPMSLPDIANVAPSRGGYQYGHEALDLFAERVRAVQPDFVLDSTTRPLAAELCQRLDGLPLAIELAAVQMRALSIEQIVERLGNRYRLLRSGNRGGPARHQTLRATVDWSYDLCSAPERALWSRLSVFAGGFDLDAVEAVCADAELPVEDVVEPLAALINKSIAVREGSGAEARYRLLETIRAYGRDQLAAIGAEDTFRARHRDYYLGLASRSEQGWFGPNQMAWWHRLRDTQANLWAALDYSLTHAGDSVGTRMAGALCYYWNACGHLQDGRYWIDRALAVDSRRTRERAKALWVNGWIAMTQGDNDGAMGYFDECVDIAVELADVEARTFVQQFRGSAEQFAGNLVRAKELLSESTAAHERAGLVNSLSLLGIAQLAFVSCLLGDADRAIELCDRCRAVCEPEGEQWALSWGLWVAGLAHWTRGEHGQAAYALDASLAVKYEMNDRLGMSACVELLAWIAMEDNDFRRAAQLFGAGHTLWATIGSPLFGSAALVEHSDRYVAAATKALGVKTFGAEYRHGAELSISDSMALASGHAAAPADPVVESLDALSLTRRETEVAALVAEGLSNREIANRLVISQRTAEGHVERVLVKLGFKSRSQVAAWLVGQRNGH
jgi:non-specific serine/threonine protein kinase